MYYYLSKDPVYDMITWARTLYMIWLPEQGPCIWYDYLSKDPVDGKADTPAEAHLQLGEGLALLPVHQNLLKKLFLHDKSWFGLAIICIPLPLADKASLN